MKDRFQQRRIQEIIQEVAKIEVLVPEVRPTEVPAAKPSSSKGKKKVDSETKVVSFEASSARKSDKKKKKEPSLEPEEEEELTTGTWSSKGDAESEEEPSTPPPKPKARMGTRSTDKKKPLPVYKSSVAPKQPTEMPQKGEGSNKKPRGK